MKAELKNKQLNEWEVTLDNGDKRIFIGNSTHTTEESVLSEYKPKTEEQIKILEEEHNSRMKIEEAKQYLNDTDWMVTKVTETKLQEELGYVPEGTTATLVEKYRDISIKRYEARKLINGNM